jgi:hypothetical protein
VSLPLTINQLHVTGISLKIDIRSVGQEIYRFYGTKRYITVFKNLLLSLPLWIGRLKIFPRFFLTYYLESEVLSRIFVRIL